MANEVQLIEEAIKGAFPWLPPLASEGDPWVLSKERTHECGYGVDDDGEGEDDVVGAVGFEDAVFEFEERDRHCMYTELENLQAEIDRRKLPYWLEPHYSFLWLIRRNEVNSDHCSRHPPPHSHAPASRRGRLAVHDWFGLSYASYLVLPRVLMQYMPDQWQQAIAVLLEEFDQTWDFDDEPMSKPTRHEKQIEKLKAENALLKSQIKSWGVLG